MDLSQRESLTAFIAVGIVAVLLLVLFIFPGYLISGRQTNPSSGIAACSGTSGEGSPVYCETVAVPPTPTRHCASGSNVSYVFHGVTFTLQPYTVCLPLPGWGINCTVTELTGNFYGFRLEEGAPPILWLNWTSPDGRVSVDWLGTTSNVTLVVSEGVYAVTFTETGLATGTNWSISLSGTLGYSRSDSIAFLEPNGTYAFTVESVSGYAASPSSGEVTVTGSNQAKTIVFSS